MSAVVDYKKEFHKLVQEIELEANKELSNEEEVGTYMYDEVKDDIYPSSDLLADSTILYARSLLGWIG